jgi:hypothetical protein
VRAVRKASAGAAGVRRPGRSRLRRCQVRSRLRRHPVRSRPVRSRRPPVRFRLSLPYRPALRPRKRNPWRSQRGVPSRTSWARRWAAVAGESRRARAHVAPRAKGKMKMRTGRTRAWGRRAWMRPIPCRAASVGWARLSGDAPRARPYAGTWRGAGEMRGVAGPGDVWEPTPVKGPGGVCGRRQCSSAPLPRAVPPLYVPLRGMTVHFGQHAAVQLSRNVRRSLYGANWWFRQPGRRSSGVSQPAVL